MNKKGNDFISSTSKEWSKLQCPKPSWSWSDSQVQERIMRLGVEAKVFEVDINDINDLESVAIATLRQDFLQKMI